MGNHCWVFAALIVVSPLTSAEIFKCTDSKGNVKYQNFPCQIDSIGSSATALPPQQDDRARNIGTLQVRSKPASKLAETPNPNYPREVPRVGMSRDTVRVSLWGEPMRVENTETGEGAVEIWYYDDTRTVQFDDKGRVFLVEQ